MRQLGKRERGKMKGEGRGDERDHSGSEGSDGGLALAFVVGVVDKLVSARSRLPGKGLAVVSVWGKEEIISMR
jgi:hypothetical protein